MVWWTHTQCSARIQPQDNHSLNNVNIFSLRQIHCGVKGIEDLLIQCQDSQIAEMFPTISLVISI